MAIRDVVNAFEVAFSALVPPGNSVVTPSQGATGTVTLGGTALGSFQGVLTVLATGALGTATAVLSLDNGNNYGNSFTIPTLIGQPYSAPLDPSPILSGLTLGFAGAFTGGDSYKFTANGTTDFQLGEEFVPYQDIFPRVVFVPINSDWDGPKDFSLTQNQTNSTKSLLTDRFTLEAHCWGVDLQRSELLRDQLINAIHACTYGHVHWGRGDWTRNKYQVNKAGRVFVLSLEVDKPVLEVSQTWVIAQPPFTEVNSQEVDH